MDRIRRLTKSPRYQDEVPRVRALDSIDYRDVFEAVARYYRVDAKLLLAKGNGHVARAAAAWLSRRFTTATLRELAQALGLGRPESVSNLTRRMDRCLAKDSKLRRDFARIENRLAKKTKNKV